MHEDLPQSCFAERRRALLGQLPDGASVLLFAPAEVLRNGDVVYPYRPNSYFWYLTGFPEPDAAALLQKKNGAAHYTLFSQARDPMLEIWNGRIIGQEAAKSVYGADDARPTASLDAALPALLADSHRLYAVLGNAADDARLTAIMRGAHAAAGRGGISLEGLFDVRQLLDNARLIKCPDEQALLAKAGKISAAGHCAAMLAAQTAAYEYQVQAALEAAFRQHGCGWSFPSIVAGGANACCLHYHANHAALAADALLLVDAGAEYAGYAGDITRTFPVRGRFSPEQRVLYQIVLDAQQAAVDAARPGIAHLELHRLTAVSLMQGMIDAGIIQGNAEELVGDVSAAPDAKQPAPYRQWYPHGTGHWLGLDVHDVGVYKIEGKSRRYQAGMAITIEPGLYIQPDDTSVDEKWRGIGIRIEDDAVITAGGCRVLTADVPKTIEEIEYFLRHGGRDLP